MQLVLDHHDLYNYYYLDQYAYKHHKLSFTMAKINKVVITAAGRGTRLYPYTKEIPKEMMPVYSHDGNLVLKPILQIIFESLYNHGSKTYCFVVGKGKRSIEDHFITHSDKNPSESNDILATFFNKIHDSNIIYVQQSQPRGFGDAVNQAKFFVGNDNFFLHAGDDLILSKNNDHLARLEESFLTHNADMAFLVSTIDNPQLYGVIEGEKISTGTILVKNLEEKPKNPNSNMAVIGIYIFKSTIFDALSKVVPDKNGEIQLSTAMQDIIKNGKVIAVELNDKEKRVDVGTPTSYIKCLQESFDFVS